MKNLIKIIFALAALSFIISSCDEISAPYTEDSGPVVIDTSSKRVFIEKFTGFRCGNCPPAGEEAHRLKEKYGDRVIVMSIHWGTLAEPLGPHTYDFITQTGNEIADYFSIYATPQGLINRTEYQGSMILNHARWEEALNAEFKKKGSVAIDIHPVLNSDSSKVDIDVALKYITAPKYKQNLAIYLVEDSIVQYQLYYKHDPQDIYDYVHDNVLRASVIGTWGEQLNLADTKAGDNVIESYSYTLPEGNDWRLDKLKFIAVVCNVESGFEVINSNMSKLKFQ